MKRKIEILVKRDQLLYDIFNKTNLLGKARKGLPDYTPELVAKLIASEDDDDKDQLSRSVMSARSLLMMHMAEYMTETATTSNNTLDEDSDVKFVLYMPSNFNLAAVASISNTCHKFMTDKCCYDWYLLKSSKDASQYSTEMESDIAVLRDALNQRTRPNRPGGHQDMPDNNTSGDQEYNKPEGWDDANQNRPGGSEFEGSATIM